MSDVIAQFNFIKNKVSKNSTTIADLESKIIKTSKSINFLNNFVEYTRSQIKGKIEDIVNSALKCVFIDKSLLFKIVPNITKRGVNYDMYIDTNGNLTPLLDCKGGGVLDIITLSIRIAFLRMFSSHLRQTLILDEPFKNLDADRISPACEWLRLISKEFEIQFIMVSHIQELIDGSDKVFQVSLEDNISKVEVIKCQL